jgi:hypothetical protein
MMRGAKIQKGALAISPLRGRLEQQRILAKRI